jgi:enterochelin esterase-like enzyme
MDKMRNSPYALFFYRLIGFFLLFGLILPGCSSRQNQAPVLSGSGSLPSNLPVPATAAPVTLSAPTEQQVSIVPAEPGATSTPSGCQETTGTIDTGVITTKLLDKPMRYNVYLPPCYSTTQPRRYPVLYLLHGQNYDEGQWLRLGAASALDRLIASGDVSPFIIVMPYDYSYKQPTEYGFEDTFIQLLIPQIDLTYRTFKDASQRAVGGLSRGGAWAIRLGTRHPELFSAIGGHSPSIFYVDMDTLAMRMFNIPSGQIPRIWLDAGDSDSEYETVTAFEKFLTKNNIPHEWHEYIGWHDETYWSAHVEEYLRWYSEEWK